jgi:hypothetical protein
MLDVHPPHAPTHTWKDFFLHIATITVGLLIAVGLEQVVEAIHHANERRDLVVELRDEAAANLITLHRDIDFLLTESEWDAAAIAGLKHAPSQDGMVRVQLPEHAAFGHNTPPNRSAWTLSNGNGKAALLPEVRAHVYELMDRSAAQVQIATEARNAAAVAMREVELKLATRLEPGATVSIPAGEVAVVVGTLAARAAALEFEAGRDGIMAGQCEAVEQDVLDPKKRGNLLGKEANAVQDRVDRGRRETR